MDSLEKLSDLFRKFPGIGPRQAQRFVQHLLRSSPSYRHDLAELIATLSRDVRQCPECSRFHEGGAGACSRCGSGRDPRLLMVVAGDQDADAVERSRTFHGTYFILGGLAALASESQPHLRLELLRKNVAKRSSEGLMEVILAFPANPEGDDTARIVKDLVLTVAPALTVTILGRGLSTGSELEYADPDTIKNALLGRR